MSRRRGVRSSIANVAVHVDPVLPIHPLTVADFEEMFRVGILGENDRVELLDGVLVEMTEPSPEHCYAVQELLMLAVPVAAAAGLRVAVQGPLGVRSRTSLPQPDLAIVPRTGPTQRIGDAVLVVEVSVSSRRIDLGRKAGIYAEAGVPDYWVLDVESRRMVVHREPKDGRYTSVTTLGEDETVTAVAVDLAVRVSALL